VVDFEKFNLTDCMWFSQTLCANRGCNQITLSSYIKCCWSSCQQCQYIKVTQIRLFRVLGFWDFGVLVFKEDQKKGI